MTIAIATVLAFAAIACMALGGLCMALPTDREGRASGLFFRLAGACWFGALFAGLVGG